MSDQRQSWAMLSVGFPEDTHIHIYTYIYICMESGQRGAGSGEVDMAVSRKEWKEIVEYRLGEGWVWCVGLCFTF